MFTNMRIDRKSLPDGLYAYDLRDECDGEICQLRDYVLVNHWGTCILKEPVEGSSEGVDITEDDYNYLGDDLTLDEFVTPSQTITQTM
ncbi:MAG: hypothetical protein J6A19_11645 [Oscillospiraceae bacterium]|nr:hypothetical protein [Oscillospiraceae bacterium]